MQYLMGLRPTIVELIAWLSRVALPQTSWSTHSRVVVVVACPQYTKIIPPFRCRRGRTSWPNARRRAFTAWRISTPPGRDRLQSDGIRPRSTADTNRFRSDYDRGVPTALFLHLPQCRDHRLLPLLPRSWISRNTCKRLYSQRNTTVNVLKLRNTTLKLTARLSIGNVDDDLRYHFSQASLSKKRANVCNSV